MQTQATSAAPRRGVRLIQLHREESAAVRAELERGLLASEAAVAPKYFYDALGSRLFAAITELDEYYPTRTEAAIFAAHADAMAQCVGRDACLVDLGAGDCAKAARLLPHLQPRRYVAVDIAVDYLRPALDRLQNEHPRLEILGLGLDFSERLELPAGVLAGRPLFFYPGSSIGNFDPAGALRFLRSVHAQAAGGGLLIGVDLVKSATILEPAYDDALGLTAAFNLNLLRHLNRLLGTDFDPAQWRHVARYVAGAGRIEMHLETRQTLEVRWPGGLRRFAAGERIHTENSYKYTLEGFARLLAEAGFRTPQSWCDERGWFAVYWAAA